MAKSKVWTVGVRFLGSHTSEVIRKVREEGTTVVVTLRGEPVAVIIPTDEDPT